MCASHLREERIVTSSHHHGVALHPAAERASLALDTADVLARLPDHTAPILPHSMAQPISLQAAYQTCQRITKQYSKSFFFSSQLLPQPKRQAIRALYALCRTSDDTVDHPVGDAASDLAAWIAHVRAAVPACDDAVLVAWDDTRRLYAVPQALVDELLAGIAMDLIVNRYTTFDELWLYCYRVASVVGLMAMHIIGYAPGAAPYAVKLGVALQLTNILRDIGEDARRGRIYLPQEDLARFGICDTDILMERHDQRFRSLMRYEIARAHSLYEEAWPGIAMLHRDSQLAIAAAAEIYRAILYRIEANDYDVFTQRASTPLFEKLQILCNVWWRIDR
jgi:phytoene synthase